jgi:hypothetical protein
MAMCTDAEKSCSRDSERPSRTRLWAFAGTTTIKSRFRTRLLLVLAVALGGMSTAVCAESVHLPEIISGRANTVPSCVTPNRLMDFVRKRDRALNPPKEFDRRFSDIASIYASEGECVEKDNGGCIGVRWDYAFFQMLVETNYLLFTGGVRPGDNNFAGIGATIPRKPGEHFASAREGVRAHLQHVLMYAGILVQQPIARRTKIVQREVHKKMSQLGRPVTFSDLAILWTGTDQNTYAGSIERTAKKFAEEFCSG